MPNGQLNYKDPLFGCLNESLTDDGSNMALEDELAAVTERDGIVDCLHFGSAVVVDCNGKVLWSLGNPLRRVFERSTTKPFRALAVLRSGCADTFGLDEGDLALIAGSHSGTMAHVIRAAALLAKAGLSEEQLRCGIRLPLGEDGLLEIATGGHRLSVLHGDCSGEHIGALALCRHLGHSLHNYLEPSHPVQRLFAQTVLEYGGGEESTSIDRCGMPTSAVSLTTIAVRMAKLMLARHRDESVARLLTAILANPMVYTGKGRIIGELIVRSGGMVFGKCGAEGLYTIVWPCGLALALKVGDGNPRAAVPIIDRASKAVGLDVPELWDCVNEGVFAKVRAPSEGEASNRGGTNGR